MIVIYMKDEEDGYKDATPIYIAAQCHGVAWLDYVPDKDIPSGILADFIEEHMCIRWPVNTPMFNPNPPYVYKDKLDRILTLLRKYWWIPCLVELED